MVVYNCRIRNCDNALLTIGQFENVELFYPKFQILNSEFYR